MKSRQMWIILLRLATLVLIVGAVYCGMTAYLSTLGNIDTGDGFTAEYQKYFLIYGIICVICCVLAAVSMNLISKYRKLKQ
jgi:hypothetical protein